MQPNDLFDVIRAELTNFLTPLKKDFANIKFDFDFQPQYSENGIYVELNGYDNNEIFTLLYFTIVNNEAAEIQIFNIFLPPIMQHHGIGLGMIDIIRTVSFPEGYNIFIVEMVNSFYRRMLKRGALPLDGYNDVVKVTKNTDLNSHY